MFHGQLTTSMPINPLPLALEDTAIVMVYNNNSFPDPLIAVQSQYCRFEATSAGSPPKGGGFDAGYGGFGWW
jgi:hypothetical protein